MPIRSSAIRLPGPMMDALSEASVLVTPHRSAPRLRHCLQRTDLARRRELQRRRAGADRTETSLRAVAWLKRTPDSLGPGQAVDEHVWRSALAQSGSALFSRVHIYRDPRQTWASGISTHADRGDRGWRFFVDGRPLMIRALQRLGHRSATRGIQARANIPGGLLCPRGKRRRVSAGVAGHGYREARHWPYAFDRFTDGSPVTPGCDECSMMTWFMAHAKPVPVRGRTDLPSCARRDRFANSFASSAG